MENLSLSHTELFSYLIYFYFFMSSSFVVRTSSRGAISPHKRLPSSPCVPDRTCLCTCASHLYQAQRVVFKSSWPNAITLINPSCAVTSFRQCLTCLCRAARLRVWSLLLSLHANVSPSFHFCRLLIFVLTSSNLFHIVTHRSHDDQLVTECGICLFSPPLSLQSLVMDTSVVLKLSFEIDVSLNSIALGHIHT